MAPQLCRDLIASHPGGQEAGYSRTQIHNIIHAMVPQQELMDAHIEMAVAHFLHESSAELSAPDKGAVTKEGHRTDSCGGKRRKPQGGDSSVGASFAR